MKSAKELRLLKKAERRARAFFLRSQGNSIDRVAELMGIGYQTANQYITEAKEAIRIVEALQREEQ